jgi:tRNA threonylcarbamoyladenosine biosynthesis protein TsaB
VALLLLIDTAVTTASVCLAKDNEVLIEEKNPSQKDHAAWLHPAIERILNHAAIKPEALDAVAISSGPGSYTGLRVGMAAAKGLCFVTGIPLIMINTLAMMTKSLVPPTSALLCPMIDARRMEVFTALYDQEDIQHLAPTNMILDENAFKEHLEKGKVVFFGNGSEKFKQIVHHKNAIFLEAEATASHMISIAFEKLKKVDFADLAYTEPYYGKAFYLPSVKPLI